MYFIRFFNKNFRIIILCSFNRLRDNFIFIIKKIFSYFIPDTYTPSPSRDSQQNALNSHRIAADTEGS